MEIVFIAFIVVAGLICWALCASIPKDPEDDEEQGKYLKEWERRKRK